tara:strand:- start:41204 stop:42787 length:1584 start_codon:yes stop_codon:yes gene_type:complete
VIPNNNLPDIEWIESFTLHSEDYDYVIHLLLEAGTPWSTAAIVVALLERQLLQRQEKIGNERKVWDEVYSPDKTYVSGQTINFPLLGGLNGEVISIRNGDNPDYGEYGVLQVRCEDDITREFVSGMANNSLIDSTEFGRNGHTNPLTETAQQIFQEHTQVLEDKIEAQLLEYNDLVRLSGSWFPVDLLVDINTGYLNLAEAALDLADGRPLSTKELLKDIGMTPDESEEELLVFSLNYALQRDERFEDVGPSGQVLWYLTDMKPRDIVMSERYLACESVGYITESLTEDMRNLSLKLRDEFSENIEVQDTEGSVEVVLTYPHLRAGTLPLSAYTAHLFPSALVSPRVKITFVDALSGQRLPGWVALKERFVWGMAPLYKKYDVITGARITIAPGDDLSESIVSIEKRNPIKDWVRTLFVEDKRFYFELSKCAISVGCVEENIINVEDVGGVDALSDDLSRNGVTVERIVELMFRQLSQLTPQGNVHTHTLYSAVNVVRRTPPEYILAELASNLSYIYVGDAYWRYSS